MKNKRQAGLFIDCVCLCVYKAIMIKEKEDINLKAEGAWEGLGRWQLGGSGGKK